MENYIARPAGRVRVDPNEHVVLSRERIVGADFGNRRLESFSSEGCRFEGCRFDESIIETCSFGAGRLISEYIDCNFDRARFHTVFSGYSRFVNCSFEKTSLSHWSGDALELIDCVFSGRLRTVIFDGSVRPDHVAITSRRTNQFEGNDFSRAKLIDVDFRTGIDLTKQRLPEGDEYTYLPDAQAAVQRARAAAKSWNYQDDKRYALALLKVMETSVANGQLQLWLRVNDHPVSERPAIREMLAAAQTTEQSGGNEPN